jgi:cardiolipin synthase
VAVVEFNPINPLALRKGWEVNQRDHRKLLVVDGRVAFMGGINISGVYSTGSSRRGARQAQGGGAQWRDTHLRVEGPVVAEFQKLFLATWEKQKGEAGAPGFVSGLITRQAAAAVLSGSGKRTNRKSAVRRSPRLIADTQ